MSRLLALALALQVERSPEPAQASAPARPAIQAFVVEKPASEIGFDGTSTLHDFTGRTRKVEGEVRLDPAHLGLAGGWIAIDAASLDTDSTGRDKDMRATLEVERFPEIRFDLGLTHGPWTPPKSRLEITGTFTIHGVAREQRLAVEVEVRPDGGLHLAGKTPLDLGNFGLEPPSLLFISMDKEVEVWFDVALEPLPGEPRPAPSRALELVEETFDERGVSRGRTTEHGRAWFDARGILWERPESGQWILGMPDGPRIVEHRRPGRSSGPAPAGTEPAGAKELRVERDGPRTSLLLGDREWARFEGLSGDAPFAELLLVAPGIPQAVRARLPEVRGVPSLLRWTTVEPRTRTERELRIGPEEPGLVPAWAFELVRASGAAPR